jgi:Right handed beta helix region
MKRSRGTLVRAVGMLATCGLVAGGVAAQAASAHGHGHLHGHLHGHHGHLHGNALFVSPSGHSGAKDRSCATAAYSTIQTAVTAAPPRATVVVCLGTYTEDVIIAKSLKLEGRHATIHGSSTANGTCDQLGPAGPGSAPCLAGVTIKSSHVSVEGFKVTGAIGEGILATGSLAGHSISDVEIEHNRVVGNDVGGIPPTTSSPYPQCVEVGQIPGDCGEGIHLMGVSDSKVSRNFLRGNTGGVLLTDEFGPTHNNIVERNVITRNAFDCGVTAPGHNPHALDASGNRQPAVAGVYDNVIRRNVITKNGLSGEGAGVLFANAGPGTASYDNLVEDNFIAGNELSGVTMHAHTVGPGQFEDLSGNRIVHNVIGQNNVGSPEAGPGDPNDGPGTEDPFTTGIEVFSGTVPVTVTISHNRISHNHYGVWLGVAGHVTATLRHNQFRHVDVQVFTHP